MLGKTITIQGIILGAAFIWFTRVKIGKKFIILYLMTNVGRFQKCKVNVKQ